MIHRKDTIANLFNTQLKDRTLYYDGDSEVSPDRIVELIDKGLKQIYVTEETDEIRQYNRLAPSKKAIKTKTETRPLKFDWNIPEPYKSLDVIKYMMERLHALREEENLESLMDVKIYERFHRVREELIMYEELQLLPILRVIIYVINTLQDKNIVWGVGRGSSVSSYVLYLIGVHDVDSVKYDLDFTDFLRAPDAK